MSIVIYSGARQQTFSMYKDNKGVKSPKNVRIVPGSNPISNEDCQCLLDTSDGFNHHVANNEISIIDDSDSIITTESPTGEITHEIDISKLAAKEAIKVINETFLQDALDKFSAQEVSRDPERSSIIKAIIAQSELVNAGDDDAED